jgi:ribosomal protein S18 acetylase RimI-like enzyme
MGDIPMSKHKLIVESWRDFLRAQFRRGPNPSNITADQIHDPFVKKYDYFYYKISLLTYRSSGPKYSKPKMVTEEEMVKIITDPRNDNHTIVRPNTMSPTGEYYDWRKFKFLNAKVQEVLKKREEEKRKEEERRRARSKKQMDRVKTDSELALAIIKIGSVDNLVLYHTKISESDRLPLVIGMIALDDMHGPCIPNTLQVKFSAVNRKFQRQGFGSILYRLAAAHAKVKKNGGISSDHSAGTSKDAARRWAAIDKDSEFYKRSTKAGSDTFDYGGYMTPDDPMDDCEDFTSNGAVTNHSYGVSDKTVEVYNDLVHADESGMAYGPNNDTDLNDKATRVFADSYSHRTRE